MAALITTCDFPTSSYSCENLSQGNIFLGCPFLSLCGTAAESTTLHQPSHLNGEDVSFTLDSPGFGSHFLPRTRFEDLRKLLHSCRAHVAINEMRPLRPQRTKLAWRRNKMAESWPTTCISCTEHFSIWETTGVACISSSFSAMNLTYPDYGQATHYCTDSMWALSVGVSKSLRLSLPL